MAALELAAHYPRICGSHKPLLGIVEVAMTRSGLVNWEDNVEVDIFHPEHMAHADYQL